MGILLGGCLTYEELVGGYSQEMMGMPLPRVLVFGMVQAASSIAMTSETLALIPSKNKSLATGLWFTLYSGGTGLSGILSGQALELEVFNESWIWLGQSMSSYDGLLLLSGTMVLLMTVTLGMIPSMIKKVPVGWIPQSS